MKMISGAGFGALLLAALLTTGCGADEIASVSLSDGAQDSGVGTGMDSPGDAGDTGGGTGGGMGDSPYCNRVEIEGDTVRVHEEDVTATFTLGPAFTRTVMLFGGDLVTFDNAVSPIGILGLDQADALMLAEKYDDFHLCSSPGGQEAQNYILGHDLVPADCDLYDQLVGALMRFNSNNAAGGDRVSLTFEGNELQLVSVIFDATGQDATNQLTDLNFQLVTKVEQLTGQSLLNFGME